MSLLEVKDLQVTYKTFRGLVKAVDGITFSLEQGGSMGIVGESGCGKSTTGKAILQLLEDNGKIVGGKILFKGLDLSQISEEEMRRVRGRGIAMIPQSAMNSLDPVYQISDLIIEVLRAQKEDESEVNIENIKKIFNMVGLGEERISDYPHMFSGGMRQRAVIGTVFSLGPSLIIADEPTTALDVIVQDQVLRQLADLVKRTNTALIMITHDIGIVAEQCQQTAVMYAGKMVEVGPTEKILIEPYHPYTMGLQNGFLGVRGEKKDLISISGVPPSLINPPSGCRFQPRCPFAEYLCSAEEPMMEEVSASHKVACHFSRRFGEMRRTAVRQETWKR